MDASAAIGQGGASNTRLDKHKKYLLMTVTKGRAFLGIEDLEEVGLICEVFYLLF